MVQALAKLDLPVLPLGNSGAAGIGDHVVAAGAGGRAHSVAARLLAKQEFAGYWEYVLDEALFTGPAHPLWGGSALIGASGELLGIGSLQLQRASKSGQVEDINMYVPIDLLKPIQEELMTSGRTSRPPRPWLGLYATEVENRVVVAGLASQGPAKAARLKTGDILLSVAGEDVHDLADLWRRLWSLGDGRRRSAAGDLPRRPRPRGHGGVGQPAQVPQRSAAAVAAALLRGDLVPPSPACAAPCGRLPSFMIAEQPALVLAGCRRRRAGCRPPAGCRRDSPA